MDLKTINKLNSGLNILSVESEEFKKYGKIHYVQGFDELERYTLEHYLTPQVGNLYIASCKDLESFQIVKDVQKQVYGEMEIQAGPCTGHNDVLNGIEYHQGSEVTIMIKDSIMILGHIWDMENHFYNSSNCQVFYVSKGTVLETYGTTLHYTPCAVCKEGFYTICILLKGTGDILKKGRSEILKKKNKWFITHEENILKVQEGDFVGLKGKMLKVNTG